MEELLRLNCIVNDNDSISFHKDKKIDNEVEIRIEDWFDEKSYSVVLEKEQIKEVIETLLKTI